jgi:hypothetical protein
MRRLYWYLLFGFFNFQVRFGGGLSNSNNNIAIISFEFDGAPDALVYKVCDLWSLYQVESASAPDPSHAVFKFKLLLNRSIVHATSILLSELDEMEQCWTKSIEPTSLPHGFFIAQIIVCNQHNCDTGMMTSLELVKISQTPFQIEYLAGYQAADRDSFRFVMYPNQEHAPIRNDVNSSKVGEDGSCQPLVRNDTCFCTQICENAQEVIVSDPEFQGCAQDQQRPILGIGSCRFHRSGPSAPDLEGRFIDLVKKSVLGLVHGPWDGHIDGSAFPPDSAKACSLIGLRRMDHMQFLLEEAIRLNVPGDFIEAGAWRGGATIFAAAVFLAYAQTCPSAACRRVFVADSFRGIPPVDVGAFPADAAHVGADAIPILLDNSARSVRDRFATLGVLSDAVVFLEGWFRDTLPAARQATFGRFAMVRLDGDTYEATWQALDNLYDLLSPGGFVIVDDYADWVGCHRAVTDFRTQRGVTAPVRPVYHGPGEPVRGVWWQKPWSPAS